MLALQRWLEANVARRVLGLLPLREVGQGPGVAARREPRDRLAPRRLRRADARAAEKLIRLLLAPDTRRQPAGARAPHGRGGADLGLRVLGRRDDRVHASTARASASAASSRKQVNPTVAHRDHVHIGMTKAGAAGADELLEPRPVIRRHTRWMRAVRPARLPARPRRARRRLAGDRRGRRGRARRT